MSRATGCSRPAAEPVPLVDPRGLEVSGASPAALDRYEAALDAVLSFHGDPLGVADAALELDPTLISAKLLKAHVLAFSLHPGLLPKAAAALDAAAALGPDARERLHVVACRAWLRGDLDAARAAFDAILAEHPRDLLALMFAQQAYFCPAAAAAVLERPTTALRAWSADLPGHGYVLGMRAFGLEEAGRYAEAAATAMAALERNRRDAWAIHAVGHVLEMQGRDAEGIAWYAERRPDWAEDCFFAVHNWWHLALYHVDRDAPAAALAVYDEGLAPGRRSITLNLCDAAALLWRLTLRGHEVGDRFELLADAFEAPSRQPVHVFVDVHAMLAFVGAGRLARAAEHLAMLEALAAGSCRNAAMPRRLGVPAGRALLAFGAGRFAAAAEGLEAVLPELPQLTGSRAQRDVLTMTAIEARIRAGEHGAARAMLEQRLALKPGSERIRRDLGRCG
jgi:tetratricopeptide (TPR) repeat protein